MARLGRAQPHRPILPQPFVTPPPAAPVVSKSLIRSSASATARRLYGLVKRPILPSRFVPQSTPPSSPYIVHNTVLSTARRYKTLPKRAILPKFVEPPKPTIIIRSTAKDVAKRLAQPRRHILPLPFVPAAPNPVVSKSIVHTANLLNPRPKKRKPVLPLPFVTPPAANPVVPPPNTIHSNRIAEALRRAKPRKPVLPKPFVTAVPYVAPVATFIIHTTAKDAVRRQAGPRKRPVLPKPFVPYVAPTFAPAKPILRSTRLETARRYATRLFKAIISPFVPVPAVGSPQVQNQFYWGRLSRGQYVNIILNIKELPDAIPTVTIWKEGVTVIETLEMPRVRAATRTFRLTRLMDTGYDDGHYAAVMRFEVAGDTYVNIGYFEISGGIGVAPNIAISEIDRSAGRAVVSQTADSSINMAYKPKKLLP